MVVSDGSDGFVGGEMAESGVVAVGWWVNEGEWWLLVVVAEEMRVVVDLLIVVGERDENGEGDGW